MTEFDAAVVGSGPNGLAAAMVLADAGLRVVVYEAQPTVGGGLRSMAIFEDQTVHDHCASVLALAELSPFFAAHSFADLGVDLIAPEIPVVHAQRDGTGAALFDDDAQTEAGLGPDGAAWGKMLRRFGRAWDPLMHAVENPTVGRFAAIAPGLLPPPVPLQSASRFVERFTEPSTKALFGGLAGHSILPLTRPETAAIGVVFAASVARTKWPVIAGGSQKLADGMSRFITDRGGVIRSRTPIFRLEEVETKGPVLFDTSTEQLGRIAGTALPERYRKKLRAVKRGPAIQKVDYLLSEPIPWTYAAARRTTTVHLGDTFELIAAGESHAWGRDSQDRGHGQDTVPTQDQRHPLIILTQPTVADPGRSGSGKHTAWAYCHVPNGYDGDLSSAITARIETHAPGFIDTITGQSVTGATELEAENANYLGGEITLGALQGIRTIARPTLRKPWSTPNERLWLCSAAAAPGPGIHCAGGFYAAKSALRRA